MLYLSLRRSSSDLVNWPTARGTIGGRMNLVSSCGIAHLLLSWQDVAMCASRNLDTVHPTQATHVLALPLYVGHAT